jgi:nitrile hydratase
MNGPQDLGGRHGFGTVVPEDETTRFHADWEKRVLGVTLAAAALGHWNIDSSRHARESLPPAVYLGASYYEIWLRALENLLIDAGEIDRAELAEGRALRPGLRPERRLAPEAVAETLARGGPTERAGPAPAFAVGDRVRARNHQPAGHTRLPGYARGHVGVIRALRGAHVFPDSNAHGGGEASAPLYTVAFCAAELFGEGADPTLTVEIDAWEPYLDRA